MTPVKIVFGCGGRIWNNDETNAKVLEILKEEGVKDLDSARAYGPSEEKLGYREAAKEFIISTKFSGVWDGKSANREEIQKSIETSLGLIKTSQVDIYYLHAPDRTTPYEETLSAIDELHKQGKFKRFGLSNFLPEEVENMVRVAKEKGFIAPTVYQGSYSPVSRLPEESLFPILRKHGIAFYAYSPLAGGVLTKSRAEVEEKTAARFDGSTLMGKVYTALYHKKSYFEALTAWDAISVESGIPKAELAYRWVAHHSHLKGENGDALIIGASKLEQIRETIQGIRRGPLPDKVANQIEEIWEMVKHEAGLDNFNYE
ncbi:NADP-dependent oxidoreductase domain-containing protein [Xylogone sp. PMI_703]|nr:NADP-dependent oxidoreductase domain-containing protein [Xylogone sp. PMI_703]